MIVLLGTAGVACLAGVLFSILHGFARRAASGPERFLVQLLPAALTLWVLVWVARDESGAHGTGEFAALLFGALSVPSFLGGALVGSTLMQVVRVRARVAGIVPKRALTILLASLVFLFFGGVALLWFMIRGDRSMWDGVVGAILLLAVGSAVAEWCSSLVIQRWFYGGRESGERDPSL